MKTAKGEGPKGYNLYFLITVRECRPLYLYDEHNGPPIKVAHENSTKISGEEGFEKL